MFLIFLLALLLHFAAFCNAPLFCLDLSFFGWRLLGILTLGIGNLWVNPYSTLSTAAFYRWRCQENPAFAPPAQETP